MKYPVALQKTAEGYSASVPGLPGCWSQGKTKAEALKNIRAAIRDYLAARKDLAKDWFASLREYSHNARAAHDLAAMRRSVARARSPHR